MHSGYQPTNKWYTDFWYGLTSITGALGVVFVSAFNFRAWDWEAIGVIVGVVIAAFTVAGIVLGFVSALHYLGVF